jgi:hypothetical protein
MRHGLVRTAVVALVVLLGACTPQQVQQWAAEHGAQVDERQATAAVIVAAFAAAGASSEVQQEAVSVAMGPASCGERGESGGDPNAQLGVHVGVFQLSGRYHRARAERLGYTWEQVATEVYPNARTAADLQAEQGWTPWACKPL